MPAVLHSDRHQETPETLTPRETGSYKFHLAEDAVRVVEEWIELYRPQYLAYGLSETDILAIRARSAARVRAMADLSSRDPLILDEAGNHKSRRIPGIPESTIRHVMGHEWRLVMQRLSMDSAEL